MLDLTLLAVFVPTFFLVSITPGMCMTLAMTLGMSIGVRRTLWMMLGEVCGVAVVAVAAVLGVAGIMLNYPALFLGLKWLGTGYLCFLAIAMWRAKSSLGSLAGLAERTSNATLVSQGFITAISNPKGWAFMMSLLPPFISMQLALAPQLTALVAIIMLSEFVAMLLYASGGKRLRGLLQRGDNIRWMNRIAASLMLAVALWLLFG